jgi:hypothetical protein
LHNESMNVWTHFVAALVYLTGIAPYMFWMRLRDAPLLALDFGASPIDPCPGFAVRSPLSNILL